MASSVEITFDCLPLRSVGRLDVPLDASPGYIALCERVRDAIDAHGPNNTYYLYRAKCLFRLLNHPDRGVIEFKFEGTAMTDAEDRATERCDLTVELVRETCDWLTEPVANWFAETVSRSVKNEFDRYIEAGDLEQAQKRVEKIRAESDEANGFLGMYL